jgi:hypothetical protein
MLKAEEKRIDARAEHREGPYRSIIFPARAAKGYWLIIALHHGFINQGLKWWKGSDDSRDNDCRQLRLG